MRAFTGFVATLVLALSSNISFANHETGYGSERPRYPAHQPGFNTWFAAGAGFGGDELGRFLDEAGEVEKITAGQGGYLEGGLVFGLDPWSSIRLSGGCQTGLVSRINGDSSFDRFQFAISALRTHGAHEFGAGLTMHTGVNYSCNIDEICSGNVDFDPALGYTLEYALRVSSYHTLRNGSKQGLRLGVRYTGIEYQPQLGSDVVSGNSLAAFIGVVF